MVLAADLEPPPQPVGRRRQCGRGIAPPHDLRRQNEEALRHRFLDRQHGLEILVLDDRPLRRRPRRLDALGGDGEKHLAMKFDEPVGEQRLVPGKGADVVDARHVRCRQHGDHAGDRPHGVEFEPADAGMCAVGHGGVEMQCAGGLRDVVDIDRLAADMLAGAVMRGRAMRAADDRRLRSYRFDARDVVTHRHASPPRRPGSRSPAGSSR